MSECDDDFGSRVGADSGSLLRDARAEIERLIETRAYVDRERDAAYDMSRERRDENETLQAEIERLKAENARLEAKPSALLTQYQTQAAERIRELVACRAHIEEFRSLALALLEQVGSDSCSQHEAFDAECDACWSRCRLKAHAEKAAPLSMLK